MKKMNNKSNSMKVSHLYDNLFLINLLVSNYLGTETIEHFDDNEVGLVRHLGVMDARVTNNLYKESSKRFFDEHIGRFDAILDPRGIIYIKHLSDGSLFIVERDYNGNRDVLYDGRLYSSRPKAF